MKKAFIFDIEGTLIDSNDLHAKAWEKAFAADGITVSAQKIRLHIGKGPDQLLPKFLEKDEVKAVGKRLRGLAREIFKQEYLSQVRPFPKVRELFQKIREAGGNIALASSSKTEEIAEYRIIAQIHDLVEKTTSTDDPEASKLQPNIFYAAMMQLGNPPPKMVLVVGDTPYDARAAKRARLPFAGVLCGGFSEEVLRTNGCRTIYQDPADILANLEEIMKV